MLTLCIILACVSFIDLKRGTEPVRGRVCFTDGPLKGWGGCAGCIHNVCSLMLRTHMKTLHGVPGAPPSAGVFCEYFCVAFNKSFWILSSKDKEQKFSLVRVGRKKCMCGDIIFLILARMEKIFPKFSSV